jgi:predicted RNase H-like HicB family nuclease
MKFESAATIDHGGHRFFNQGGRIMKYLVVIEKGENHYSASIPDLPGCVATGADQWSVLQAVQEAACQRLAALAEAGQPAPPPASFYAQLSLNDLLPGETSPSSADPALAVLGRFVEDLLRANYPEGVPAWHEPVQRCRALPRDVEALLRDAEALLHTEDEASRFDLHSGLLEGKVGSLKCSLISFLHGFFSSQAYFEAALPACEAFADDLPALGEQADPLKTLRLLAVQILGKTYLIREQEYNPYEVCYFIFWLSRTVSMMLVHTSAFDMVKVFDEEEFGESACGDDDCGCGCDHDHDCDCDCEECDGDCDCDCDCDCEHDHDDDCDCGHHHGKGE